MARRILLFTALVLVAACSNDAPPTTVADDSASPTTSTGDAPATTDSCPTRVDQTDVAYVDGGDPLQQLDLYLPPDAGCEPVPLVVWVHGGGWQIGDKRNSMDSKVALWTNAGWAVASVNYRLTDTTVPEAERLVAPAHNEDVAAALAWLIANASDVGIDPDHIALLGHSAGAGITAAVATDPAYLRPHGLDPSAIACAGPLDTEGFDIPWVIEGGGQLARLYQATFGTDPARWAELSPINHVGEAPLPELILVTRGTPSRRAYVEAFAETVEDRGGTVAVIDLPTFSHEDVNRRIGDPTDDELTPVLQQFLTSCLSTRHPPVAFAGPLDRR